ncbi:hypothetical protein RQP46_001851 [Phenoliferia psychrophenolica]
MSSIFKSKDWFKEVTVYQIYPSSFCDSNGNGTGTLAGVTSKLDYLKRLGVDVVWLSPVMTSPWKDGGYDISNYKDIREEYGTLQHWDDLKNGIHARGMKLMMDLVVNHSSDEHAWFKESRSSKTNPKRDWYHWQPAKIGPDGERLPPNNWESVFGGESAWTWDELTEEYYLRLFVKEQARSYNPPTLRLPSLTSTSQPDLNWEHQPLREAVYDAMRFWLDRGCDGFRMDVINLISKVPGYPDCAPTKEGFLQPSFEMTANGPRVHEFLQEMHREVLSKYDTITVGETPFTHDTSILAYSRPENKELQMVFTFELHDIDGTAGNPRIRKGFELRTFKEVLEKYQRDLWGKGWNSLYLDQARSVSRFANDSPEFRTRSAKVLATLHNSLCGTVYIYEGDEIGMKNVPSSWTIDDFPDVATKMYWQTCVFFVERIATTGEANPDMADVLDQLLHKARDNARTPMQWDTSPHAGFTTGKPWMRVNEDFKDGWNVADQEKDSESVLSYWKQMLQVRKSNPVLVHGEFTLLDRENPCVFAYTRKWDGVTALVILSFAPGEVVFHIPHER